MAAPDQLLPKVQPACLAPRHWTPEAIRFLEARAAGIGVHEGAPHLAPLDQLRQRRRSLTRTGPPAFGGINPSQAYPATGVRGSIEVGAAQRVPVNGRRSKAQEGEDHAHPSRTIRSTMLTTTRASST